MFARLSIAVLCGACSLSAAAQTSAVPLPPVAPTAEVHIRPAHPATEAQIREYFALTHLDQSMKTLMTQMVSTYRATSAPYFPESFWEDMNRTLGSFDFLGKLVPVYQEYISEDDLGTVIAFYKTTAGRHLLEAQPLMMAETQKRFREMGQQLGLEVAMRHKDEIAAAQKKYEEEIAARQNSSKK